MEEAKRKRAERFGIPFLASGGGGGDGGPKNKKQKKGGNNVEMEAKLKKVPGVVPPVVPTCVS
jgi:hypothetical protein